MTNIKIFKETIWKKAYNFWTEGGSNMWFSPFNRGQHQAQVDILNGESRRSLPAFGQKL